MYAIRSYYGLFETNATRGELAHPPGEPDIPIGLPGGDRTPKLPRLPMGQQRPPRITSYNVCYTKLLRQVVWVTAPAR